MCGTNRRMFIKLAIITLTMLALDGVWLTATAATSRRVFAAIQGKPLTIRWVPTVAVYALMVGAVWFFAVRPASDWPEAAALGAALGFAMYGLYDLTNLATLSAYPVQFAITDMVWGTTLFAVSAGLAAAY